VLAISYSSSILSCRVWKQRDVTRALDGFGEHTLMRRARARNSSRQDFAALWNVVLEELHVLEIDQIDFIYAEATDFATVHATPAAAAAAATAPSSQINIIVAVKAAIIIVIARHNLLSSQSGDARRARSRVKPVQRASAQSFGEK
jgi:hypothetical protein